MSAPLLFLDVDGVLNHEALYATNAARLPVPTPPVGWLDRACVARINALCERTGAQVVISSGWRRYLGVAGALTTLRAGGLTAKVLGATPVIDVLPHDHPDAARLHRWGEIRAWLDAHPEVTRWVVIDDVELAGVPAGRQVRTDIAVGITDADCDRAAAALGCP